MITWLNHIAIAVPDLDAAATKYRSLGAEVSDRQELPAHGVAVVFVKMPNTKIELLHPLGEDSPIAGFLERNPGGGVHHLCFEVTAIGEVAGKLSEIGVRVLGDGAAKIGAHGRPVLFAHPKDFQGVLVEFEQT